MPADVSFHDVTPAPAAIAPVTAAGRLPLGIGLVVAASASIGLWFAVAAALRAVFS